MAAAPTDDFVDQSEVTSRAGAFHKSHLKDLHDCPKRYERTYLLGEGAPPKPAGVGGTAYHLAVETHEQARVDGGDLPTLDELIEVAQDDITPWVPRIPDRLWGDVDEELLRRRVTDALTNWYEGGLRERLAELGVPSGLEVYAKADVDGLSKPIAGTVDWVGDDTIVDHKTAKAFTYWKVDKKPDKWAEYQLEALHYVWALVWAGVIDGPMPFEFHVARKKQGKTKAFQRIHVVRYEADDLADPAPLLAALKQAEQVEQSGRFLPNPASNLCQAKWCPFFADCQGPMLAGG